MSFEKSPSSLVTVVVTYNGLHWIDRCLGSLRDSTVPTDVIVVDNTSTDGTQQRIAESFPGVELVRAEKNLGFGQANNIGIRLAIDRGASHVFLLNQDAWLTPGALQRLIERSGEHPEYGILSPIHLNGSGDALDLQFSKYIVPGRCPGLYSDLALGRAKESPYPAAFVNAAAWLITARCLHTVGGFNPSFFHYGEDDNYVARLHFHKLQLAVVAGAHVHHDRAERGANPYMIDMDVRDARRMVLEYSNPMLNKELNTELNIIRRSMLKHMLLGRVGEFHKARRMLKLLQNSGLTEATANREISKQTGLSFL